MDKKGIIDFNGEKVHIRDLFFEIFKMGQTAHISFDNDSTIQVLFDYWIKEKLKIE